MTTDDTIDMASLARFAILPGASPLMRAFSAIPPGPLRDSVISHAQVIAQTYGAAPASNRMPDPIAGFGVAAPPVAKLTSRTGKEPRTDSPEMRAVKMRMEGASVAQVMQATGLEKKQVYQAVYAARKAGMKVPSSRQKSGPVEPGTKVWITSLDEASHQGIAMIAKAARTRGINSEEYLARRQLALKLAQDGASYDTILERTGEKDAKVVSAWLSSARGAGYNVPYVTSLFTPPGVYEAPPAPEPVAEPAQEAVAVPVGEVFRFASARNSSLTAMRRAAESRGMTLEAYHQLRESVVRHRMNGMGHQDIVTLTGQSYNFVKDTLALAKEKGVQFPPYPLLRDAG
jgi:transposase